MKPVFIALALAANVGAIGYHFYNKLEERSNYTPPAWRSLYNDNYRDGNNFIHHGYYDEGRLQVWKLCNWHESSCIDLQANI